ncbi:MAG: hypothetical protein KF819_25165 [Labilithrix sp.]|nr:hypothetical protein [Labilithrix sp.]
MDCRVAEGSVRRWSFAGVVTCALWIAACSNGPSKAAALDAIQAGIKEDGSCTLPLDILSSLKVQHATKGICVPKEASPKVKACVEALVAANITHRMPDDYMVAWPDDVSASSLSDVPAYERRARNLVFSTCVELAGNLRDGRFNCAEARAEKILRVKTTDETHADVTYAREIGLKPSLPAIDAACGTATRPPGEATVAFVKTESGWGLPAPPVSAH